jgi:anti-sigma factor RsiW
MNHPHEDRLLLFAYGELPEPEATELETHLGACVACREALERLERARVALEWGGPARSRPGRWVVAGLAAAAVLVAAWVGTRPPSHDIRIWPPPTAWSATAGYLAGGTALVQIDSQLTRLEQEPLYAIPR